MELTIIHSGSEIIAESANESFPITLQGLNVDWVRELSTPMGKKKANYQGVIDEGQMKGSFSIIGGMMAGRSMNWHAKRIEK